MPLKILPPEWRQIQRKNFTQWESLADFLELDPAGRQHILKKSSFPLNLPQRLASKIKKNRLDDPILKQFLPLQEEDLKAPNFSQDPNAESCFRPEKKLLHKYSGRALLVCTSSCAMHCRYCFRRHFSYEISDFTFENELAYISKDPTIKEVILSGGDPLSLSNSLLKKLIDHLGNIPHLKKLRFHTRFPIGIPERIDAEFLALIKDCPLQVWFVIHVNHPAELDSDIFQALKMLQEQGATLLNQSVLLKGVNNCEETLYRLYDLLTDHGILPYYLHLLDRVDGATHFEVEQAVGKALIDKLRTRLPGYAVPLFVSEEAGHPNKLPL